MFLSTIDVYWRRVGPDTVRRPLSRIAYESRVTDIANSVFDRAARAVRSTPANGPSEEQLLQIRGNEALESASKLAVVPLRSITPPIMYREGHDTLIRYFMLGARYSLLEATTERRELTGLDTSSEEDPLARLAPQLGDLLYEAGRSLPFLHIGAIPFTFETSR
jgi:hypothetical protein